MNVGYSLLTNEAMVVTPDFQTRPSIKWLSQLKITKLVRPNFLRLDSSGESVTESTSPDICVSTKMYYEEKNSSSAMMKHIVGGFIGSKSCRQEFTTLGSQLSSEKNIFICDINQWPEFENSSHNHFSPMISKCSSLHQYIEPEKNSVNNVFSSNSKIKDIYLNVSKLNSPNNESFSLPNSISSQNEKNSIGIDDISKKTENITNSNLKSVNGNAESISVHSSIGHDTKLIKDEYVGKPKKRRRRKKKRKKQPDLNVTVSEPSQSNNQVKTKTVKSIIENKLNNFSVGGLSQSNNIFTEIENTNAGKSDLKENKLCNFSISLPHLLKKSRKKTETRKKQYKDFLQCIGEKTSSILCDFSSGPDENVNDIKLNKDCEKPHFERPDCKNPIIRFIIGLDSDLSDGDDVNNEKSDLNEGYDTWDETDFLLSDINSLKSDSQSKNLIYNTNNKIKLWNEEKSLEKKHLERPVCQNAAINFIIGLDLDLSDSDSNCETSDYGEGYDDAWDEIDFVSLDNNLQKANTKTKKWVHFAEGENFLTVYPVDFWERKGPWEEFSRDRHRFERQIQSIEKAISFCFDPIHRLKIFEKYHQHS